MASSGAGFCIFSAPATKLNRGLGPRLKQLKYRCAVC
jgi:hypothetical protein